MGRLGQDTVKPWEDKTGNKVEVIVASDRNQQLSQGFAAGSPPDLFFTEASAFPTYAKAGNMVAYGDQLPMKSDFYENLVKTFTYDGKQYCAPKDFSTLALQINTDSWTKAGLGDADIPTTWEELEAVSKTLTTDGHGRIAVRLSRGPSRSVDLTYAGSRRFLAAVGATTTTICRIPKAGRPVGPRHRKTVVRRFPYVVVYRYDDATDTVIMVAVFHTSRDPNDLLDRLT